MDKRNRLETYLADLTKRIAALEKRMPYKVLEQFNQAGSDKRAGLAQRITVQGDTYYIGADGNAVLNLGQFTRLGIGAGAHATIPFIIGADVGTNRPIFFNALGDTGWIKIKGSNGGWATLYGFMGDDGAELGGLWTLGSHNTLSYFNIGTEYNDGHLQVTPAGAVSMAHTLTLGAPDTADAVPLLRVWGGTAGTVDSPANTLLTLETSGIGNAIILAPTSGGYFIGDAADADVGGLDYDHTNDIARIKAGGVFPFGIRGAGRVIFDTAGVAVNAANTGAFDIIQNSATDDIPVLFLRQDDPDEPFIHLYGADIASASTGRCLVDKDRINVLGNVAGLFMVGVTDTGDLITDGDYYVPFYSPTFKCHA